MTFFVRHANTFQPTDESALDIHTSLPVGNYIIQEDSFGNMYYEEVDSFEFTGKRYGDNIRNTERIMNTFLNRTGSTGVMLVGEKGSGKSLLARTLAIEAVRHQIPTVIINAPWCGDKFNKFMQDLDQPALVLFDEFEKVYKKEQQEHILTLLDGVFPTKKLFVFTCNDRFKVDSHMRNRPGRIYYMIDFIGLDTDFIREYCNDNLYNTSHIETICKVSSLFSNFNFDMLKAMVEEMNRYDETPQEVMTLLNINPEFNNDDKFTIGLITNGVQIGKDDLYDQIFKGSPMAKSFSIEYRNNVDDDWKLANFKQADLKKVDSHNGAFVFSNEYGETLTLIKEKDTFFNFYKAF